MSIESDARSFNPLDFALKISEVPGENDEFYRNDYGKAGYALIFNQIEFDNEELKMNTRHGTEIDSIRMQDVLKKLGFKVKVCDNYKTNNIEEELNGASRMDHSKHNCLVVIMMSHGDENGKIYTYDSCIEVDTLWKTFASNRCSSLCGKPKFFFIQACRGSSPDFGCGQSLTDEEDEEKRWSRSETVVDCPQVVPIMSDILVMFSSADGFPSFRESFCGSWFIQGLFQEFTRQLLSGLDMEVIKILTAVNRYVAYSKVGYDPYGDSHGHKQIPVIMSMLTKTFVFNRDYFMD